MFLKHINDALSSAVAVKNVPKTTDLLKRRDDFKSYQALNPRARSLREIVELILACWDDFREAVSANIIP